MQRDTISRPVVGSLDGPSRTIIVEPVRVPAQPAVAPEPGPEREQPAPEREPAPAR